jgi:hypothetical protein
MYIRAGLSWASWLGEPQTTGLAPRYTLVVSCLGGGGEGAEPNRELGGHLEKRPPLVNLASSVAATLNAEGGELPPASDQ